MPALNQWFDGLMTRAAQAVSPKPTMTLPPTDVTALHPTTHEEVISGMTASRAAQDAISNEFAHNFLHGAGLPASLDEVRAAAAQALGTIFGQPESYDAIGNTIKTSAQGAKYVVTNPIHAAKSAAAYTLNHPAGAAGLGLGMAWGAKIPEGEFLKPEIAAGVDAQAALKFGKRALTNAERRMDSRVMAEQARVHASLEGPTWRDQFSTLRQKMQRELRKNGYEPNKGRYTNDFLPDAQLKEAGLDPDSPKLAKYIDLRNQLSDHLSAPGSAGGIPVQVGVESPGDFAQWLKSRPTNKLGAIVNTGNDNPAILKELRSRGWRGDISDFEHVAQEGAGGHLPEDTSPTYQAAKQYLRDQGFPVDDPQSMHGTLDPETRPAGYAPSFWISRSAEENTKINAALDILARQRPVWTREERGGAMLDKAGIAIPTTPIFNPAAAAPKLFKDYPLAQPIAYAGQRWVNTKVGWTKLGAGSFTTNDFNWILKKHIGREMPGIYEGAQDIGQVMEMPDMIEIVSNPERAAELISEHAGGKPLKYGRTITARHILKRIQAKTATPGEAAWYNIFRTGGFEKGMKWHH